MKLRPEGLLISLGLAGGMIAAPTFAIYNAELAEWTHPNYWGILGTHPSQQGGIHPSYQRPTYLRPNNFPSPYHYVPHPLLPDQATPEPVHRFMRPKAERQCYQLWHNPQVNKRLARSYGTHPNPWMRDAQNIKTLLIREAPNPLEKPGDHFYDVLMANVHGRQIPIVRAVMLYNANQAILHVDGLSSRPVRYKIWDPERISFLGDQEIAFGMVQQYSLTRNRNTPKNNLVFHFLGFKEPPEENLSNHAQTVQEEQGGLISPKQSSQ
ncbi:hypothetical protein PCANC_00972 [Puccinia coronata f. sp. avenae]|uniref:Uncharacterized protein n=1 Tax=Puccinia coronata f. sp. avenae TaxID=200324 RepID=A0A2N5W6J1_9BASI|nr:hypothetical protein PCASD_01573 [Puccinia coronata f. sp. avenae]PLW57864.1 hypothetical protein PCANC_00972 [Puccinia coronata f. sp. avenae]